MPEAAIHWTALLARLAEPFDASEVQYRAGAVSRDHTKAQALAYADPRAYEDRLNHLVPGNWEVEFLPWGEDRIICRLTIHGITRSSTGESTDSPDNVAGTSAEAQAFKRACAKFGLGRYLYALEPTWVDYDPRTRTFKQQSTVSRSRPRLQTKRASESPPAPTQDVVRIGHERGAAMRRELANLGMHPSQQLAYATEVVGHTVHELGELSEAEARIIWSRARREPGNLLAS